MPQIPFNFRGRIIGASAVLLTIGGLTALIGPVLSGGLDRNQQCVSNVERISTSVLQYAQDYDEHLPLPAAFADITGFQNFVGPYFKDSSILRCPANGNQPYTLNAALGGKTLAQLPDDYYTIEVARDSKPHPDGELTVGFLDGNAERGGVPQFTPDVDCRKNARSVTLALAEYTQDYDEQTPFQPNDDAFRQELQPYVVSLRIFTCPDTQQFYNIAQDFRGKGLYTFPDISKVIVLQDSVPHRDGVVTTAYLDGYVEQRGPNGIVPDPTVSGPDISLSNIKQIDLAALQYAQDYDERLPLYKNFPDLLQSLTPYLPRYNQYGAIQNYDLSTYQADPAFSGVFLPSIQDVSTTIYLRDVYDFGDGMITAGYLDGHAARIPAPPVQHQIKSPGKGAKL